MFLILRDKAVNTINGFVCHTNIVHKCSYRLFILDDDDDDDIEGVEHYHNIKKENTKIADKGSPLWFQNDGLEDNDGW